MNRKQLITVIGLAGCAALFTGCEKEAPVAETTPTAPPPQAGAPPPMDHSQLHHEHQGMRMDMAGAVMNENKDKIPQDCKGISEEVELTIKAGKKYAQLYNGKMFSYDQNQWEVKPCARLKVTFINEDHVRHQFMIHGLPKYIYPQGMFHMEVTGPAQKTGTFILPSLKRTYFVHCDIAQHMEKGMKAQLKAGGGDMDLPSIPGVTGDPFPDTYETEPLGWKGILAVALSALLGMGLVYWGGQRINLKGGAKEKPPA
jgi:hypothetical protein